MRDDASDRHQQRLYRLIFEHARDATIVADREGRILLVNRAAHDLPAELVERLFEESGPQAAHLARFRADLRADGRASVEVRLDGRVLAIDGRTHATEHVVVLRDVTEQRRLESELRALRRVESVGFLTASLVHDFNNLLTPIMCLGSQLERELRGNDRAQEMAREIRETAERAAGLARQTLLFARREPSRVERVNLSSAVTEVRALLERVAGPDVELELVADGSAGDTLLDREGLDRVLLNLTANARDAMPGGGRLTLRTANVTFADDEEVVPDGASAGSYVAVTMTDTGVGMSSAVRERIFERFFTTKEVGQGGGLGLAAVRRVVAESGGFIAVHSEEGRGTTVALYFPRLDARELQVQPVSMLAPDPRRGSETVLVVDDDDVVRSAVRLVLEEYGYRVLDAACSEEALEIARTSVEPIDLLVADVVMPRMGGGELARRFKALRATKVLLTSGGTDSSLRRHGVDPDDGALLRKAFTPSELLRKVRELLDGGEPVLQRPCG